jgi:arabinogalactan endo-1,4-beta-galactosidase
MGADISMLSYMQQQGVVYKQGGVATPADEILYNAGDNVFRLRIFVNPDTNYNDTDGAIQSQAYDITLAQQIKADDPSAQLMLDFHYSDTWADPGHQTIPAAWQGESLPQLENTVESYTDNTLLAFKNAGVMPTMVQVGNEVNNGMLWPTGQLLFSGTTAQQKASWQSFGGLINSAIAGVRAAQGTGPAVQVAIHIANGDQNGEPQYFFGNLTNPAYGNVPLSSFDIMGVSYYPTASGALQTLTSNLTTLADTYNKNIMVLETDTPSESTSVASDPDYPDTQTGQLDYLLNLASAIRNLPNGDGEGVLYWYPESVPLAGHFVYNGGATALFDSSGNALPAVNASSAITGFLPEPGPCGMILAIFSGLLLRRVAESKG